MLSSRRTTLRRWLALALLIALGSWSSADAGDRALTKLTDGWYLGAETDPFDSSWSGWAFKADSGIGETMITIKADGDWLAIMFIGDDFPFVISEEVEVTWMVEEFRVRELRCENRGRIRVVVTSESQPFETLLYELRKGTTLHVRFWNGDRTNKRDFTFDLAGSERAVQALGITNY